MGLIFAGIVVSGTVVLAVLIFFANGMSDAPSHDSGTPLWPTLVIGFSIAGVLVATHYWHIPW